MTDTVKRLTTNLYEFKELIGKSTVYVDKTDLIYYLIGQIDKAFFLTRPRRFGKSLLISTLEQVFLGNKQLFKGLAIYETDYNWQEYPIIRLDMGEALGLNLEEFVNSLNSKLVKIADNYGVSLPGISVSDNFRSLIAALKEKESQSVVILIDEYDKPITDKISSNKELAKQNRAFLRDFYGVIKSSQEKIHFAFLTGVSKFSKAGVFSGLNNVTDISQKPEYATLCGYTKEELVGNFDYYINESSSELGLNRDEFLQKARYWYNGYRFSDKEVKVYNPYSCVQLFSNKKFKNYWFSSGVPKLIIDEIGKKQRTLSDFSMGILDSVDFDSYDLEDINIKALMYYTGYTTIVDMFDDEGSYIVDFPNYEIKKSLTQHLLLANSDLDGFNRRSLDAVNILRDKDFAKFKDWLYDFYTHIDYQDEKVGEGYYKGILQAICYMVGVTMQVEQRTNKGRIDALIFDKEDIYIFEFKVGKSAKEALQQIKDKNYPERFKDEGKNIYQIGVSFSMDERNIADLEWEIYVAYP